jgi:hypothetical protein
MFTGLQRKYTHFAASMLKMIGVVFWLLAKLEKPVGYSNVVLVEERIIESRTGINFWRPNPFICILPQFFFNDSRGK